jgi:hypothetical protein
MDKWEQVARETCAAICRCDSDGVMAELLIAAALRQCEADTIRRCAGVIGRRVDQRHGHDKNGDVAAILALLPKEPGQ